MPEAEPHTVKDNGVHMRGQPPDSLTDGTHCGRRGPVHRDPQSPSLPMGGGETHLRLVG